MERDISLPSLPKVSQLGVVVRDVDEVVKYYSKLGFGPFRITTKSSSPAIVHGRPEDYTLKIAFGLFGGLELELIQVLKGKTIHKEFLDEKGEGLEHVGFLVEDFEAEVAKWQKLGVSVLQRSKEPDYAYLDTGRIGGVVFELINPKQIGS